MKKALTLATIIVSLSLIPTTTNAANKERPKGRMKYDLNLDDKIDAIDASAVLAEYAKTSSGAEGTFNKTEKLMSDFNDDGKVDAVDASNILAIYAQNSTGEEPYPIACSVFYPNVKVGSDVISCGEYYSYEEALASIEQKKEEIAAQRKIYSECYIQMTTTIMTDLPQALVKFVYREKR